MATYFVDFVNGLDANNGLGPDASHATNKPWKTIAKLIGAAGMASGDTAYLSPAGPFREVVTAAMTSAVAETKIMGDYLNLQGFKTSGGVLVTPGEVRWTAWTTNDTTAASATALLTLSARDFLTFEDMTLESGAGITVLGADATNQTNMTFRRCYITALTADVLRSGNSAGTPYNWLIENCIIGCFSSANWGIKFRTARHSADYDVGITIRNCLLLGGTNSAVIVEGIGAGAGFAGGLLMHNCTAIGTKQLMRAFDANLSTTIPILVYNCFHQGGDASVVANVSGQIVENYNVLNSATPRTNVSIGANSKSNVYPARFEIGQSTLRGLYPRNFGAPTQGSPFLGFGTDASVALTTDLYGRPRPAGGSSAAKAAGALERGNTWGKETTTVRTGSNALSITGPGYQDFDIPVDASATTVTCYLRQDTTYAGTSPKLIALANAEIGVTEQTDTLAVADDTWEQLSVAFTPTAKGIVTIRLLSSDTNGGGKAFADDFGVA